MVIARYNLLRPLQYKKKFDESSKPTDVFVKGCLNTLSYGFRLVKKIMIDIFGVNYGN
tara:strand:- start:1163 stop:1336 length:174 start_codon:yes stop_codon:yes gene_type:complete